MIEIPDDGETPPSPEKTGTGQEMEGDSTSSSLEKDGGMKGEAGEKEKEKEGEKEESSTCSPKREEVKGERAEVTSILDSSQPKGQSPTCLSLSISLYTATYLSVCLSQTGV